MVSLSRMVGAGTREGSEEVRVVSIAEAETRREVNSMAVVEGWVEKGGCEDGILRRGRVWIKEKGCIRVWVASVGAGEEGNGSRNLAVLFILR